MASALVHMTSVSHCMQLSDNLMMLGMETGFEPYSEEGSELDVSSKRPFPELEEDHDRSLKKRRKQSKPVRIASSDSLSDDEIPNTNRQNIGDVGRFEPETFLTSNLPEEKPVSSNHKVDNINVNKQTEELTQKNALSNKKFPLNLSNIKPSTSFADSLLILQINESNRKTSSVNLQEDTVYPNQEMMNDETESKKITPHENSYLSSSSSPLLYPYRKQIQLPNITSQINSPLRIFNPEAFCDLCNKEFCNKYFLKTHKANKHGIYMDNIGAPPILDSLPPFMSYFSTASEVLCQNTCTVSRPTTKKIQIPQPSSLFSLKSNGNMRAFCDICQREFCNKYFVRRHKAKIHGIIDTSLKDGSSSDGQDFKAQCSSSLNNSQAKFDGTVNDSDLYNIPSGLSNSEKETEYNIAEKVSMKKEIDCRSDGSPDPLSGQLVASSFPSFFHNIQSQNGEQTKETSLSPGRIKKLGIVNTDAFCDICCKEYCNKYFLRTHKLKCHGIMTPEIDRKDDRSSSNSNQMWYSSQSQTTPLNLIVTDQGESNFEISEKVQYKSEDTLCLICQRSLPNVFLLKMHYAHMHSGEETAKDLSSNSRDASKDKLSYDKPLNLQISNIENKAEPVENSEMNSDKNFNLEYAQKLNAMFLRLHSSNAGENSVCDVCNKDVGHVSLLEHHVMKHHACLLEEEEENSNSQDVLSPYSAKHSCHHCQKYFLNSNLLVEHISEFHNEEEPILNSTPSPKSKTCNLNNDGLKSPSVSSVISQQDRDRQNLQTPTNSFCDICKKELCNKYFMKTHMQRMHGISIENGAHIGGVVCDICNKELCSKYFLRVHKQNSHGIVEEVFLPQLGLDGTHSQLQSPTSSDPALKPSDPTDLHHRYFTHFTEVCMICSRRFRGTKWLKSHLLNDHGEEGREKWKEFQSVLYTKRQSYERSIKETLQKSDQNIEVSINTPTQFKPNLTSDNPGTVLYSTNEMISERHEAMGGINQIDANSANTSMFSMIINGKDSKNYHCSYCSFSTTVLAFLFIHERSHLSTSTSFSPEGDQTWQCTICLKILESKDLLERHTASHKAAGLIEYLGETLATNEDTNVQNKSSFKNVSKKMREERLEEEEESFNELPTKRNMLNLSEKSVLTKGKQLPFDAKQFLHDFKQQDSNLKVVPDDTKNKEQDDWYKCKKCEFVTNNLISFNNHLEQNHTDSKIDEELLETLEQIKDTLSHIARKAQVPALFAVPQSQDPFTMQAFILEGSEEINNVENAFNNKRFNKSILSSIVFLPVKEKFKYPVTASFKLTPT